MREKKLSLKSNWTRKSSKTTHRSIELKYLDDSLDDLSNNLLENNQVSSINSDEKVDLSVVSYIHDKISIIKEYNKSDISIHSNLISTSKSVNIEKMI